jgi:pyruvate dehydrogenase E2 component (dihydrolipoamide acetyltransferase)
MSEEQDSTGSIRRDANLVGYGVDPDPPKASQTRSRRFSRGSQGASPPPDAAPLASPPARLLAYPPVRRLARDLGIDLTKISGSGAGGIITREDVLRVAPQHAAAASDPGAENSVAVTGARGHTAARLSDSRRTIPDATAAVWADCSALLVTRNVLCAAVDHETAAVLTPFTLILRFVVMALIANPLLNSSFDEAGRRIIVHSGIHLGFGADTDHGLFVPVVRDAHQRSTVDLVQEVGRLTEGARRAALTLEELGGSTFTVSNYGALGLDDGQPIINPGEAAILGIGRIARRPVVFDEQLTARPTAKLVCCFDHRVFDGREAARFLRSLRELIESPSLALLSL